MFLTADKIKRIYIKVQLDKEECNLKSFSSTESQSTSSQVAPSDYIIKFFYDY